MDKFSELKETPTPPLTPTRKRNIKRVGDKSPVIKHIERYIIEKHGDNKDNNNKKDDGIRLPELVLDDI